MQLTVLVLVAVPFTVLALEWVLELVVVVLEQEPVAAVAQLAATRN